MSRTTRFVSELPIPIGFTMSAVSNRFLAQQHMFHNDIGDFFEG